MKRKNPKFFLRPDTGTLQLQYSYKGVWFRINSHIKAENSEWDESSQRLKGNRLKDNELIITMIRNLEDVVNGFKTLNNGKKPDVDYVRMKYAEKKSDSIMSLYEEYMKKKEKDVVNASIHTGMKVKLELFCESKGYKSVDQIDNKFKDEFQDFLTRSGLQNITIRKRLKVLKEFLNYCEKKGAKVNKSIEWKQTLNINKSGSNIIILTLDEFNSLRNKELEPRLERVRDVYVLGCATGLRYSDLVRLSSEYIRNDRIEITTQKTGDFVRIPMNEISTAILNKYENTPPRISDQKLNKYLYELFREMKITDKVAITEWKGKKAKHVLYDRCDCLSIHTSRKFFITHCISLGVTPDAIMAWTGHRNLKVFYDYVQKGRTGESQMKNIFKLN